jgi:hypothetical protein
VPLPRCPYPGCPRQPRRSRISHVNRMRDDPAGLRQQTPTTVRHLRRIRSMRIASPRWPALSRSHGVGDQPCGPSRLSETASSEQERSRGGPRYAVKTDPPEPGPGEPWQDLHPALWAGRYIPSVRVADAIQSRQQGLLLALAQPTDQLLFNRPGVDLDRAVGKLSTGRGQLDQDGATVIRRV